MTSPDPPPRAEPPVTWTVLDVLKWTSARFAERGLPSPRLDAELLAGHAFGLPRVGLYTQFDRPLSPEELARFRELVKRRQAGEPVAYLTGRKHFWSLELDVDRRVLVPRPDTETAVEAALDLCRPRPPEPASEADTEEATEAGTEADTGTTLATGAADGDAADAGAPDAAGAPTGPAPALPPLRIADIGTGSGAIALVLKKELPHADILAVDSSAEALEVARGNAGRLGLAVTFLQGDLLEPLADRGPFDLLVANLPYVPSGDIPGLAPEVRNEPLLALDGGADGLALVRRLLAGAGRLLRPGGAVVLEIGIGQAEAVVELAARAGLERPQTRLDLGGIARVVVAHRPGEVA
jgi:release factor glutamine methyltransferase